jgi:hypothetical protein
MTFEKPKSQANPGHQHRDDTDRDKTAAAGCNEPSVQKKDDGSGCCGGSPAQSQQPAASKMPGQRQGGTGSSDAQDAGAPGSADKRKQDNMPGDSGSRGDSANLGGHQQNDRKTPDQAGNRGSSQQHAAPAKSEKP